VVRLAFRVILDSLDTLVPVAPLEREHSP